MAVLEPCGAQSDGNAPLLLELPASTRALGIGGAFVLSVSESDALFHNQGALVGAEGVGVSVQRYGSASTLGSFSAATEWAGGNLAVGVQALSYTSPTPWLDGIPSDANELLRDASIASTEMVGSFGYAREVFGFRVGVGGKLIEHRIGRGRDATAAADIGVVKRLSGVTIGISLQNLGPGLSIGSGALPLPVRTTLGVSSPTVPIGPLDVLASGSILRRRDGQVIPSGGLELSWWPIVGRTFYGRVGMRRVSGDGNSPYTLGLGFRGDMLSIDYAFEQFDAPGASHRLGLSWR